MIICILNTIGVDGRKGKFGCLCMRGGNERSEAGYERSEAGNERSEAREVM